MKKLLIILLLFIFNLFTAYADETLAALDRADGFFTALKKNDFEKAWSLLTEESRSRIVDDVIDSYKKEKQPLPSKKTLELDFAACDSVCKDYWSGFLLTFKPEAVLDDSEWTLGVVKSNYIEIQTINIEAKKPAIIKMFKEEGFWRVGLTESFWLRRFFHN